MGDRYTINTTEHLSRLVINDVTLGDAGIYDIDVVNDVGRDSGSMAITVEGKLVVLERGLYIEVSYSL